MKLRDRMIPARVITHAIRRGLRPHLVLFWRDLWHVCDDLGRFEASPALLRAVLFSPLLNRVSERDVQSYLQDLHVTGFIKLYTVKEVGFGKVLGFEQPGLRQKKEEYPDEDSPSSPELFAVGSSGPGDSALALTSADPERKKEERKNPIPAAAHAAPKGEIFLDHSDPRAAARDQAPEPEDSPYADLGARSRRDVEQPLFLALCRAEGSDPALLTPAGRATITKALNQIIRAQPLVTVQDIERKVPAYRRKFPTADLTAFALAKHWARLDVRAIAHTPLVEEEPDYWRELVNDEFPTSPYARGGESEGAAWEDLPAHVRRHFIAQLPAWLARTGRTTSHAA